ncbi:DUF1846 domain-containing protein [Metamycoplasma spumans]|uniref:DUF1846 domain-containing protein n=1 Tax=Metamycoplasma spumans TaxID=92406 RepID=UPI0034DD5867
MEAFNLEKYLKIQSEKIIERIKLFNNRLYLEFGGKLFDDYHAMRVLPGYHQNTKLDLLLKLKDKLEIIIAISSKDILKNKMRSDIGISYDKDVLRLIDTLRDYGFLVNNVVITQYKSTATIDRFKEKLEKLGINVALHYPIDNYPNDPDKIISKEGFYKNDYIKVSKELIVITAPGPGSGKLAVALSQIYHESLQNIYSGYAKFETFPIWNLSIEDPINLAYEAATVDLDDKNLPDYFYWKKFNQIATNYNRDLEAFPILKSLLDKIYNKEIYSSPTEMGVNMVGFCFNNIEKCHEASKKEIIRRYYKAMVDFKRSNAHYSNITKLEAIIKNNKIDFSILPCIAKAKEIANKTNLPATAIYLKDNTVIYGKTTKLMGSNSSALLNALKYIANIEDSIDLIDQEVIKSIQELKINILKNKNPRLHIDEILIALTMSAKNNENAKKALLLIDKLKGCDVHSTVILSKIDEETFAKIGLNLTEEPIYEDNKFFHK